MKREIIDTSIRCEADKVGASWFTVPDPFGGEPCRVLTFTQRDAEWLAKNTPPAAQLPQDETPTLL